MVCFPSINVTSFTVGTGSSLLTVNFPGLSVGVTTTVGFSTLSLQGAACALCISCFSCCCKKTSNQSNLKKDDLFWLLIGRHTVHHGGAQREESEAAGHVATRLERGEMNAGDRHTFFFLFGPGPQPTPGMVLPTVRATYLPFFIYQI